MKRSIYLLMLTLLQAVCLNAQSIGPATLNASGGSATMGAAVFEWSVGEMTLVSSFVNSGIIVTQGILQPVEVTLGVAATTVLPGEIRVFPNPASDVVNIQCSALNAESLSWKLFDMSGKELNSQKIVVTSGQATGTVDLSSVAAAIYILEVTIVSDSRKVEIRSYKIQKNQ